MSKKEAYSQDYMRRPLRRGGRKRTTAGTKSTTARKVHDRGRDPEQLHGGKDHAEKGLGAEEFQQNRLRSNPKKVPTCFANRFEGSLQKGT